jgi:iron complex transport system ATP-binding protein
MPRLKTEQLTVTIADTRVCHELSVTIDTGECWALLGRNGAGKTTLLNTLAGLRSPGSGDIRVNDASLTHLTARQRAQQLGIMFQSYDDVFPGSVLETAMIGRHPFLGHWQGETEEDYARAYAALEQVNMSGFDNRQVNTLSGGERRRLALATLLTQDPPLLFLDEPTNHLDWHHQILLLEIIQKQVRTAAKAAVMVMHDVNLAVRFCDRFILLLGDGDHLVGNRREVMTEDILTQLYRHPVRSIEDQGEQFFLPR